MTGRRGRFALAPLNGAHTCMCGAWSPRVWAGDGEALDSA